MPTDCYVRCTPTTLASFICLIYLTCLFFSENVPGSGIPDEMPEVPPPVEGQILYPCAMHGVPEMQWR